MIHSFKIKPIRENAIGYKTFIDDKKVTLSALDIIMRPGEIPLVKTELVSMPDAEFYGELEITDNELIRMVEKRLDNVEFMEKFTEKVREWCMRTHEHRV